MPTELLHLEPANLHHGPVATVAPTPGIPAQLLLHAVREVTRENDCMLFWSAIDADGTVRIELTVWDPTAEVTVALWEELLPLVDRALDELVTI